MSGRCVLVTRPAREAQRWIQLLRERGVDARALPLLAIEPLADDRALRAMRACADRFDAWMFVSAAAVEHFLDAPPPDGPRCWATGPGTASALAAAGVPPERIDVPDAQAKRFDSEALWRVVRPQVRAGRRVLFVRGADASGEPAGRDWLSRQVTDAGGEQEVVAAYRRVPPPWDEAQRRDALAAAHDGSLWLFSSSQAIANLREALPQAQWSGALAIATHPRIAQSAQAAGFGRVVHSSPGLDALVASIESFR